MLAPPASPPPAAAPARPRLHAAKRLLATAWQVPGDDPQQAQRLRHDQWRAIIDPLPASVIATAIAVGLLLAAMGREADLRPLGPVLIGLVLLNGFNFALWWWERER
ncbi:MAG: hypothetical protein IH940_02030 [Acidobacteria bacterium]|nr:hypothetical protein [Acidobacteriota bacterium]